MNPFEIIDNINEKKGFLDKDQLDDYVPFVVNRALSFQKDNIFHANQMNMLQGLDPDLAYTYLYYTIPKKKRWGKWEKFKMSPAIKQIMDFFECSYKKAYEYERVLTKEQMAEISQHLAKKS
jgi:hypothetical protein